MEKKRVLLFHNLIIIKQNMWTEFFPDRVIVITSQRRLTYSSERILTSSGYCLELHQHLHGLARSFSVKDPLVCREIGFSSEGN